jgi:hypothetical protein
MHTLLDNLLKNACGQRIGQHNIQQPQRNGAKTCEAASDEVSRVSSRRRRYVGRSPFGRSPTRSLR